MEHLVAGCKQGDWKAQEALYKQLSAKMMGVCMRYAANRTDAEDILQMGFVKMFQKISDFKNEGSFEGWVRRIMVNTAIELYRKNVRSLHTVELDGIVEVDDANALSQLAVKDLMQLVQNLPDGYRMVFNLYAIEGYSHKEIAEQLGISEGGSKSQLSRARNYLQEKIRNWRFLLMNNTMEKTFDKVFKDKLGEVSVTPSPQVWENISVSLEPKQQKKRVIYPWLGLDASVLLVSLGAWWFFLMNQAPLSTVKVVKVQQMPTRTTEIKLTAQENLPKKEVAHIAKPLVIDKVAQLQQDLPLTPVSVNTVEPKPSTTPLQPEQQQVAVLNELPSIERATVLSISQETTLASAQPSTTKPAKKRICSLSDLVNFVVAKVDNREEKVLETSSDEAILSLTSLNVGPLKFKKNNTEK